MYGNEIESQTCGSPKVMRYMFQRLLQFWGLLLGTSFHPSFDLSDSYRIYCFFLPEAIQSPGESKYYNKTIYSSEQKELHCLPAHLLPTSQLLGSTRETRSHEKLLRSLSLRRAGTETHSSVELLLSRGEKKFE